MHFTIVEASRRRATMSIASVGAAFVCVDVTVFICLTVTCTHRDRVAISRRRWRHRWRHRRTGARLSGDEQQKATALTTRLAHHLRWQQQLQGFLLELLLQYRQLHITIVYAYWYLMCFFSRDSTITHRVLVRKFPYYRVQLQNSLRHISASK